MGVSQFIYDEKCFYQGKMMVPTASAQRFAGAWWRLEACDHLTVCKPISKFDPGYRLLVKCTRDCQQVVSSIDSMNPFVAFLFITNFADSLIS